MGRGVVVDGAVATATAAVAGNARSRRGTSTADRAIQTSSHNAAGKEGANSTTTGDPPRGGKERPSTPAPGTLYHDHGQIDGARMRARSRREHTHHGCRCVLGDARAMTGARSPRRNARMGRTSCGPRGTPVRERTSVCSGSGAVATLTNPHIASPSHNPSWTHQVRRAPFADCSAPRLAG